MVLVLYEGIEICNMTGYSFLDLLGNDIPIQVDSQLGCIGDEFYP